MLLGGHFLSRPLFRFIAESRLREIFTAAALLLVVGIALLLTPALLILSDKLVLPRLRSTGTAQPDAVDEQGTVVIAGNGRFGQIVNRLLVAGGVRTVVPPRTWTGAHTRCRCVGPWGWLTVACDFAAPRSHVGGFTSGNKLVSQSPRTSRAVSDALHVRSVERLISAGVTIPRFPLRLCRGQRPRR